MISLHGKLSTTCTSMFPFMKVFSDTERTSVLCCRFEKVKYHRNCYKTYRWAFIAEDVFSVDLCTLVQRIARVYREFTLQTLAAAICPRGAHLQSENITRTLEHSSKWGRKRKYVIVFKNLLTTHCSRWKIYEGLFYSTLHEKKHLSNPGNSFKSVRVRSAGPISNKQDYSINNIE